MRRDYLVCYDISDPKRLRRVFKTMRGFGDSMQYSVFRCALTTQEKALMIEAVLRTFHAKEDRLMIVDLGQAGAGRDKERVEFLGRAPREEADAAAVIV
jgi:CRISPR-associated protein Cas2